MALMWETEQIVRGCSRSAFITCIWHYFTECTTPGRLGTELHQKSWFGCWELKSIPFCKSRCLTTPSQGIAYFPTSNNAVLIDTSWKRLWTTYSVWLLGSIGKCTLLNKKQALRNLTFYRYTPVDVSSVFFSQ